ncbi:MAG: Dabb family protein [Bacteroidetes bacterium]|jgi:hypothetical protein|nr:Dabb family protein [Bacteroidota bacterium]
MKTILTLFLLSFAFTTTNTVAQESSASQVTSEEERVLVHTVYFWFTDEADEEDSRNFYGELKKLSSIPLIKQKFIGVPASTEQRDVIDNSYDYSITFVFENKEAEKAYQEHPDHLEFIDKNAHLWEKVRVYDAITP